jgi:hypothetical protein
MQYNPRLRAASAHVSDDQRSRTGAGHGMTRELRRLGVVHPEVRVNSL